MVKLAAILLFVPVLFARCIVDIVRAVTKACKEEWQYLKGIL